MTFRHLHAPIDAGEEVDGCDDSDEEPADAEEDWAHVDGDEVLYRPVDYL